MIEERDLAKKFKRLSPFLDELGIRMWAATEVRASGRGGLAKVQRATGLAKSTISRGLSDLDSGEAKNLAKNGRGRREGGGRKKLLETQPELEKALNQLVDPVTRGDPECALRWTCKGTEKLAGELRKQGFNVSADTVGRMLRAQGYSLQSTRKRLEGKSHPDRNKQFEKIARHAVIARRKGNPVVSIDTKKKELVGRFANKGQEWMPKGQPAKVHTHDFPSLGDGKAVPYGIYDVGRNEGFVSVGVSHDTAEFAVATLRTWWNKIGKRRYAEAETIFITADCGGSNSYRSRLWKAELQKFSDDIGIKIRVAHYPPGTSKWNKIEHRLFSAITNNWRGRPLESYQVVVDLIGNTRNTKGLKVTSQLDGRTYEKGREVSDEEMDLLSIRQDNFHGEWNYVVQPRR